MPFSGTFEFHCKRAKFQGVRRGLVTLLRVRGEAAVSRVPSSVRDGMRDSPAVRRACTAAVPCRSECAGTCKFPKLERDTGCVTSLSAFTTGEVHLRHGTSHEWSMAGRRVMTPLRTLTPLASGLSWVTPTLNTEASPRLTPSSFGGLHATTG